MGIVVKMSLWVWMVLDSGVCSVPLPEITDGKFIDECVREHNRARSSVSPPASDMLHMTWDEGLAVTARAWARRCAFEHNIYLQDGRRVHRGNVNSRRPYDHHGGGGCSGCEGDCVDNLCRYNWTPDWDAPPASGSNYVTILIVRPTALLFTFITAYAVHYFYPNVFCYE